MAKRMVLIGDSVKLVRLHLPEVFDCFLRHLKPCLPVQPPAIQLRTKSREVNKTFTGIIPMAEIAPASNSIRIQCDQPPFRICARRTSYSDSVIRPEVFMAPSSFNCFVLCARLARSPDLEPICPVGSGPYSFGPCVPRRKVKIRNKMPAMTPNKINNTGTVIQFSVIASMALVAKKKQKAKYVRPDSQKS